MGNPEVAVSRGKVRPQGLVQVQLARTITATQSGRGSWNMLLVNVNHYLETKQLCISLHIFNWHVSISIIQCDQTHVHPITNLLDFVGFMTSPTWNSQRHKIAEATLAASLPRSSCTEGTLSDLSLLDHQCCLDADGLLHGEQVSGWSGPSHSAVHSWSCLPTFGSAWDVPKDRKIIVP